MFKFTNLCTGTSCCWAGLQAFCGGKAPCARSSSAAAITGDVMLIHGGQTSEGEEFDHHANDQSDSQLILLVRLHSYNLPA